MGKIIYVPLEHVDGRYTIHMDQDIENYLRENGYDYIKIMPKDFLSPAPPPGHFLNAAFTSKFKAQQMAMIAELYEQSQISSADTFFFSDIWFPGIESLAYMNYFHNITPKITGVIHAGSFTDTDFVRDMERWAKNLEDIIFDISDTIYCASEFIRSDIIRKRIVNPQKLVVSGLPLDVTHLDQYRTDDKENIVVFNGRLCDEKQPWLFDQMAQVLGTDVEFVKTQEQNLNKHQYYQLLARSKVVVSFALQENFGFGVAEAAYLGCVPVLPNRLVYPELYAQDYLYDDFTQAVDKVKSALDGQLECVLKCNVPGVNQKCLDVWFGAHNEQ